MTQYIDKDAIVAEIERRKQVAFGWMETAPNDAIEAEFELCDDILSFINTLEVKEVDLETDVEKEYVNCYIDIFDKKFPIMPTLKGQCLHDYKNFLNTCQQIFGLKWWGMHPTQAILFEKLSLLWATWGTEHLQIGQAHGEFDTPKVKETMIKE